MLGFSARSFTLRSVGAVTGAAMVAASASMAAGTASAAARPASGTGYSVAGSLNGVAATSVDNAWAVGATPAGNTLILRWNGQSWARQSSPAGTLNAVAASSAANAWAVGNLGSQYHPAGPLALHWNGTSWRRVSIPGVPGEWLSGVAAISADNAWAVGTHKTATTTTALILHWNGRKWSRIAPPAVKKLASDETYALSSVSASSASNVWTVGPLIAPAAGSQGGVNLHWNGKTWREGPIPPGPQNSVVVVSASDVWTSGCVCGGNPGPVYTAHWNGKRWTYPRNPFSTPGNGEGGGTAVVAAAPGAVWAAGENYSTSRSSFLMRWTGSAWKLTSFAPDSATFAGVAVTSASNAWAVGSTEAGKTLIMHWNGSAWH